MSPAAASPYRDALIEGVPHVQQKPDFCGEACAEMALRKLGRPVDQDAVFAWTEVDPAHGRGAYTRELAHALLRLGFRTGPVWSEVAANATDAIEGEWRALHADLVRGIPSIICTRYDESKDASEHFRLILGYDAARDEVIYHEPAEARGAYRRMARRRFLALWPLTYRADRWTVIRMRLDPGTLATPPPSRDAAYAQHVRALKERLPEGFTLVIERPFVVVGDGPPEKVRSTARGTVRWAVEQLKRSYFARDPEEIIDVWLFQGKASYERHTKELFDDEPDTPYGYYSPQHRALIMNIATGGGTLVHEIVHPFVHANFPAAPGWLNEGLGSLYEQSGEGDDGRIRGLTNWRLAGLQEAIRRGGLTPFKKLTAQSEEEFYDDPRGTNYGQSRYLCYYLQERGLLERFYHEFFAHRREDRTGFDTLRRVLGEPDMVAFQRRWESYVLGLRFR